MLLRGVHPYEHMGDWEEFNETFVPEKGFFYSSSNMEDIAHADYLHKKRVCKVFQIKSLREHHDCMFKAIHHC